MEEKLTQEQLEEYVLIGIEKYHLSNEQLICNLAEYGMERDIAKKEIIEIRKKHNLFSKKHILDEKVNVFTDMMVLIYFCFIAVNVWSFIKIIQDKDAIHYLGNMALANADAVLGGMFIALSIFAAVRMFFCKSDAPILSYTYLVLASISNIACLVFNIGDADQKLFMVVWCVAFGLYVWASPTFNKNFPKAHCFWFDIAFIVVIFIAVALALICTDEKHKEKNDYWVYDTNYYQIDLGNYKDRLNEWIPYYDKRIGSVDKVEYSTEENVVTVCISDTVTDKRMLAVMDNMSEYYSESSLNYYVKISLPDSLGFYLYGTGASIVYNLAHRNGDVYLSKKMSNEEWLDTLTSEQYEDFCRDYVHFAVDMANAVCPVVIDKYTTLTSLRYEAKQSKVIIRYDLEYDKKTITDAVLNGLYESLTLGLHYQKGGIIASYIVGNIFLQYDYYDKNGEYFTSFEFSPEQLKEI